MEILESESKKYESFEIITPLLSLNDDDDSDVFIRKKTKILRKGEK